MLRSKSAEMSDRRSCPPRRLEGHRIPRRCPVPSLSQNPTQLSATFSFQKSRPCWPGSRWHEGAALLEQPCLRCVGLCHYAMQLEACSRQKRRVEQLTNVSSRLGGLVFPSTRSNTMALKNKPATTMSMVASLLARSAVRDFLISLSHGTRVPRLNAAQLQASGVKGLA